MLRTKTTMIIGAGASAELHLPGGQELLSRIIQGYDFSRLGTEAQTRDGQVLLGLLTKMGERTGKQPAQMVEAAERIRVAARLGSSIDTIIEQYDHDKLVGECGKLAIAYYIGQAEARSNLKDQGRLPGELPLQGKVAEYWLFHLGQLVTSGVPKSKIEQTLDDLTIICFNYDRAIEHFLPHALVMAYGLQLTDAQRIVAARLRIIHPYGTVGRLPWQNGEAAQAEWGADTPWNIHAIAQGIRTASECMRDQPMLRTIRGALAGGKRLVFMGFGFAAQNMDILFDYSLSHNPEVLVTSHGMAQGNRHTVAAMIKRMAGLESDDLLTMAHGKCFEVMRDYSLMLEN